MGHSGPRRFAALRAALAIVLLACLPALANATVLTLGTAAPYANADGLCALVEAIVNANDDAQTYSDCPAGSGADVIELGASIVLDGSTLFPASQPIFFDTGDSGLPEITSDITLRDGSIERGGAVDFRFAVVQASGALRLQGVTFSGGRAVGHCGFAAGGDFRGCGGAIVVNQGTLTLRDSLLRLNNAVEGTAADVSAGGAVMMFGGTLDVAASRFTGNGAELGGAIGGQGATASIAGTVFDANSAVVSGGAIRNGTSGKFTIVGSSFSQNQVTAAVDTFSGGGAIDNAGSLSELTVINSGFTGNSAANGGAINNFNASDTSISNSSFSGNSATIGGAILNHGSGATVNVFSSTIQGNIAATRGGGIANGNLQAGIANVQDSVISGNTASSHGGGIASIGNLSIGSSLVDDNKGANGGGIFIGSASAQVVAVVASTLSNNVASGNGGGLHFTENPGAVVNSLTVTDSSFHGNHAKEGGGLYAEVVDVDVSGSTFSNNDASNVGLGGGGGIHIRSFVTTGAIFNIGNSTVSGNTATQDGGGIYLNGSTVTASISSSTVAGNAAASANGGDGIHNLAAVAAVSVRDTLVANNGNRNCFDTVPFGVTDGGNNISSDGTCGFADTGGGVGDGVDPLLVPLADNGGRTLTHALQAGSKAIDQGSGSCPAADQRGAGRTGSCDIGAFETVTAVASLALSVDQTTLYEAATTTATVKLTLDNSAAGAQPLSVEVPLRVTGSASGVGVDYTLSNQNGLGVPPAGKVMPISLSAAAGSVVQATFTVTAVDDTAAEGDESILIEAGLVGNAKYVSPNTLALTVVSNDEPALTLGTSSIDFGDVATGTVSATQAVLLTSTGTAPLHVGSITAATAPFAVAGGSCAAAPFTLLVGNSCTIEYSFAPVAAGAAQQLIQIPSDAASSPDTLTLKGNGKVLVRSFSGPLPSGTIGTLSFTTADPLCSFDGTPQFLSGDGILPPPPDAIVLTDGVVQFGITDCAVGATVNMCMDYGVPLSADTSIWKAAAPWRRLAATISGSMACFGITDGDQNDNDGVANGNFLDRFAAASPAPPPPVPVNHPLMLWLLTLCLALLSLRVLRWRRASPD